MKSVDVIAGDVPLEPNRADIIVEGFSFVIQDFYWANTN